jgi:heme/copper-type cytochrome/quinol oxidase subunit 2
MDAITEIMGTFAELSVVGMALLVALGVIGLAFYCLWLIGRREKS